MLKEEVTTRRCSVCKKIKLITEFSRHARLKRTKRRSACKACQTKANRAWIERNPEKIRAIRNRAYAKRKSDPKAKARHIAGTRAWRQTPKGKRSVWNSRLVHDHGITLIVYEQMLKQQKGRCAICRLPPSGKSHGDRILHIDHNHKTGKIRGLLCRACNTALGLLKEDIRRFTAAISYVRDGRWVPAQ